MAYDADPVTLDIHEQLSGGVLQLSHMSFDPLIRWTKELAFEPRLATSFQRLNATTVRFTLRKGVKFHDGTDFNADAVLFNIDRIWDAEHPYRAGNTKTFDYFSWFFGGFKGDVAD